MPTVAVTDYSFDSLDIEASALEAAGFSLRAFKERRPAVELIPLVSDADAVLTQFAPVTAEVIAAMTRARVIVRYGIGVDNVDLEAARQRSIPVCNVPDYCTDEVADHTLAFLLAVTRQVVPHCLGVRGGAWKLATPLHRLHSLRTLTVSVIGFGRIGRAVVARLKPFGCRIVVHDPAVSPGDIEAQGCCPAGLDEALTLGDVVTLHCPSTPATRGLINRARLATMKPGAIFVNLARGDLADPDALIEALQSGHLSAAALDVFSPEPIPADHPLLRMDNVVVSPHIASASVPAVRKLRETAVGLAVRALTGQPLPNVVNGVVPG